MEPVQSLMPGVVARLVRSSPLTPEKIAFAWRAAVGPAVSRATRIRLTGLLGVLEVTVEDDRFGDELARSAPVVLRRLQDLLGVDAVYRIELQRPGKAANRRRRGGPRQSSGRNKGEA
jgi:hypothetical protein